MPYDVKSSSLIKSANKLAGLNDCLSEDNKNTTLKRIGNPSTLKAKSKKDF
jgi:hypothetical protein